MPRNRIPSRRRASGRWFIRVAEQRLLEAVEADLKGHWAAAARYWYDVALELARARARTGGLRRRDLQARVLLAGMQSFATDRSHGRRWQGGAGPGRREDARGAPTSAVTGGGSAAAKAHVALCMSAALPGILPRTWTRGFDRGTRSHPGRVARPRP